MSEFDNLIDELLGDADALSDIRIVTRRLWFYDFNGYPTRIWQGKGKLFTVDGNQWLGSIDSAGTDHHKTPALQDGRDGSSANYTFSMTIPSFPGQSDWEIYNALKADQSSVYGRYLTCYLAVFQTGEAMRPQTPLRFFKQLIMQSPTFSEKLIQDASGMLVKSYTASIVAKDANLGRSETPNRTYCDTTQKEHARQLGITTPDQGCEYLSLLANRTYTIP